MHIDGYIFLESLAHALARSLFRQLGDARRTSG
jgi:hypothetical protein